VRRLPGPVRIAGGISAVGGAILIVLDLSGRIFGGGGTVSAALDSVSLLNPNTTRGAFVAQNPDALPPTVKRSDAVGGVFLVKGHGDARRYTIEWSVIDGDTGQFDTQPGWSNQLGDTFAPKTEQFSRLIWVPIPDGMGSFRVVFNLHAAGADAVDTKRSPVIPLSSG
jgi:hypothetical protein